MTDFSPNTPAPGLPSIVQQGVASAARAAFNAIGGMLVTAGVLTGDQSTQLASVGVAVAIWAATWVWSQVKNRNAHKAVKTALVTPVPVAPGTAGSNSKPLASRPGRHY